MPRDIITIRRRGGFFQPQHTAAFNNFIARTSGLDVTHQTAYANFLDGLTADGFFNAAGATSFFDLLYIFATQNSTTALLNLVSSSFTSTTTGPPTFTTDRGYTGTDAAPATNYLDTTWIPNPNGVNYTQNSAHVSAWVVTNNAASVGGCVLGTQDVNSHIHLFDTFTDGNVYARINDAANSGSQGAPGTRVGHWFMNRTGASASAVYQNASLFGSPNQASGAIIATNSLIVLGQNTGGGNITNGSPQQVACVSAGASMTGTQITTFYNRLRTYMTAVGVP